MAHICNGRANKELPGIDSLGEKVITVGRWVVHSVGRERRLPSRKSPLIAA